VKELKDYDIDSMSKRELVALCKEQDIWYKDTNTAAHIRTSIRNILVHDIITRMAKQAGRSS